MVVWIESIDVYIVLSTVITLSLLKYCQTHLFCGSTLQGVYSLMLWRYLLSGRPESSVSRTSAASIKPGIFPAFRPSLVAWQVPVESYLFLGSSYLSQQIEFLLHHCSRMYTCASKNIYISLAYPTHDPWRGLTTQLSPPEFPVSWYLRRGVRSESLPPTVSSVST